MNADKKKRLAAAGWQVGSTQDFLDLSPEDAAIIDIKARLAVAVAKRREQGKMTQAQFAKLLGSSQSRVAKIEAADRSVSLDLLVRSMFVLGATPKELALVISKK